MKPNSLRTTIARAEQTLAGAGVASPGVDARLLAAHILGVAPLELMFAEPPAGFDEAYAALVARRAAREPLQHITGTAPFADVDLAVGPGVFIPRPETELLAEWAVRSLLDAPSATSHPIAVDLGSGSGAIAITIAHAVPSATVYAVERSAEARRYFSKSSLLDPRFAPSWIAFGHSFSLEGESDQAVTAYSTAARKFPFSGLPRLFIGMEHLLQGNKNLAVLFLESSAEELGDDPLCANERGVAAFLGGQIDEALGFFHAAIRAAEATQQPAGAWVHVHLNLGLAYNRLHRNDEARTSLLRVIESDPSCATAYIALGMCAQREGDLATAIDWYHEGLGIDPRDPVGTELLTMALEARLDQGLPPGLVPPSEESDEPGLQGVAFSGTHDASASHTSFLDRTQGSSVMDESG